MADGWWGRFASRQSLRARAAEAEVERLTKINTDLADALVELVGDPSWGCDRHTYVKARRALHAAGRAY